jgi:hypothetical protein
MRLSTLTKAALAHDLGADLHSLARRVAAVCAVVYVAGMATGVLVHWLNDRLAGGRQPWPVRLGQLLESPPVQVFVKAVVTYDGAGRIAGPFQDLSGMSVAELRQIARERRIYPGRPVHLARRADLIAAIRCSRPAS